MSSVAPGEETRCAQLRDAEARKVCWEGWQQKGAGREEGGRTQDWRGAGNFSRGRLLSTVTCFPAFPAGGGLDPRPRGCGGRGDRGGSKKPLHPTARSRLGIQQPQCARLPSVPLRPRLFVFRAFEIGFSAGQKPFRLSSRDERAPHAGKGACASVLSEAMGENLRIVDRGGGGHCGEKKAGRGRMGRVGSADGWTSEAEAFAGCSEAETESAGGGRGRRDIRRDIKGDGRR